MDGLVAAAWVAGRDLRSRLRDRSAWVMAIAAPLGLAVIISFAFGGGPGGSYEATVGVVDLDRGRSAATFVVEVLGGEGVAEVFTVVPFEDVASVTEALEQGSVLAAFVVHPGVRTMDVMTRADAPITGAIAEGIARSYAAQANALTNLSLLAIRYRLWGPVAVGGSAATAPPRASLDVGAWIEEVATTPLPIEVVAASSGASELASANYFGPGMAMLFVFFLLGSAPRSLLRERDAGTLARMRATGTPLAAVLAGKVLAVGVVALVSMSVVWFVTWWVFAAPWGPPLAVLALLVAFTFGALGVATLVSAYARTESQADGAITVTAFLLAILGGNFLYVGDMPELLQRIALATPNGWALRGFVVLTADGGGLVDLAQPLLAMGLFGVVTILLAVPGLRRQVVRA